MPAETSANSSRTPAEVLKAARQRDSADKRGRVLKAVQDMLRDNRRITFATVAREAGVSTWLVYVPGLREHIDQARARQAAQGHQDQQSGRRVSTASEHTDLLLARQEIKRLRTENGQLRQQARVHLGSFVWITAQTRGRCPRCGVRPGRWSRSSRSGWRCLATVSSG
ncbi:DUF6262 family protein [Streptomyces sp. NPDC004728]|uniref:DUF6262 family protein n=1 Tax=Streptomyces sp. NPDC004728 TaxID=3154289 RepID=UPI0033A37463